MILQTKRSIAIVFLILVATNCKDDSMSPSMEDSFYPIQIGNSWVYDFKDYDSLGILQYESSVTETIIHSRIKDGEFVYQIHSALNPQSPACCDYRYYLQNKSDGLHWIISSDSTGYWVDDQLRYKYPCIENDYFTNDINNHDTTFVISLNDTVICEAGTFRCIVYKNFTIDPDSSINNRILGYSHTYVAYGFGKIKYELYWKDNNDQFYKSMEYSLEDYNFLK